MHERHARHPHRVPHLIHQEEKEENYPASGIPSQRGLFCGRLMVTLIIHKHSAGDTKQGTEHANITLSCPTARRQPPESPSDPLNRMNSCNEMVCNKTTANTPKYKARLDNTLGGAGNAKREISEEGSSRLMSGCSRGKGGVKESYHVSLKQRPTTLHLTTGRRRRRRRPCFKRLGTPPSHPRQLPKQLTDAVLVFDPLPPSIWTHTEEVEEKRKRSGKKRWMIGRSVLPC